MANGFGNGESGGLRLSGPGGFTLSATGPIVIIILLLIAGFGGLAWILHEGFREIAIARESVFQEHQSIRDGQLELACTLALPPEARVDALADPRGFCHFASMIYRPKVGR